MCCVLGKTLYSHNASVDQEYKYMNGYCQIVREAWWNAGNFMMDKHPIQVEGGGDTPCHSRIIKMGYALAGITWL